MKNKFARLASIALVTVFAGFGSVQAATINTLYSTGVDDFGNVLPDTQTDTHYTLVGTPANYTGTTAMAIDESGGWPVGGNAWIGDTGNNGSRWIVPTGTRDPITYLEGDYVFETTFDLTGFDHNTAEINGQWAADNDATDIILNGVSLGLSTTGEYKNWTDFVINSGFIAGVNTLQFVVHNNPWSGGENPTGLRVDMAGTATVVPVPAAVWLFGSGLLGLIGYSRRKAV
jgi:hypothetical protein